MLEIEDRDGCENSFAVKIVSEQFKKKLLLARHRMVYDAIDAEMKEIHAMQIYAKTPEEHK